MKSGRRIAEKGMAFIALVIGILLAGCQSAGDHKEQVRDDSSERVTVGTVQREIRVGMTGADVAQVLGSPNIVTTDEKRREVGLILGVSGDVGGGALPWYKQSSGATSKSQRTLTVVIKFDEAGLVRDFAYHTSRF